VRALKHQPISRRSDVLSLQVRQAVIGKGSVIHEVCLARAGSLSIMTE
jgi:hypothetical protein